MEKETVVEMQDTNNEHTESADAVEVKPYAFRKLSSKDIFLMFKIIGAIGVNNFTKCFESKSLIDAIKSMTDEEKESNEGAYLAVGAFSLEAVNVILSNIGKCENDIYQLLSNTSNMTVEEITDEGNSVMFVEMLIDFFKKEEFPGFMRAVSKLFK